MTYPLWPDAPAERDLLGYADIASAIVEAIRREGLDPVAVGLFGTWGSGKSSVLEFVAAALPPNAIAVRVRPWEYDKADDPKALLIGEVLAQLEYALSKRGKLEKATKESIGRLAHRVNWTRALTLAAKGVLLQVPTIDDLAGLLKEKGDDETQVPTLAAFRTEFSSLLKDLPDIARVVVLVDDLDRCLPPSVVATLEAVKLFLSVPKMAFVLAADDALVTLALAQNYGSSVEGRRIARQYLEKIVQIPIRVPALGFADTEAYLAALLVQDLLKPSDLDDLIDRCAQARRGGESTILPAEISGATDEVKRRIQLARALARVLARTLQGNPRRLKRFVNAYWIRSDIAQHRGIKLDSTALAKLMVLEETMPSSFATVVGWLDGGTLQNEIEKLEADPTKSADRDLATWCELPPRLAKVDLGPYLRLAASFRAPPPSAPGLRAELQALLDDMRSTTIGTRRKAATTARTLSTDDRRALVVAVADAICADPTDQARLGEGLRDLVGGDDAMAQLASDALEPLPASSVEPSLVIHLSSTPPYRPAFRARLEKWLAATDLPEPTATALREALAAEATKRTR